MAPLDAMTIRLHLRGTKVLEVMEDLPERLVVAVVAIASVIRCGRCGRKTSRVHATKRVKVADLPHGGPRRWCGTAAASGAGPVGPPPPRPTRCSPSG